MVKLTRMLVSLKKIIIPLIIISMVFSFAPLPGVKKAEAIWGVANVTFDPTNWITNLEILWDNVEKYLKDYVLDAVAWVVAKELIGEITDSIVNWINSGFNGEPTFINSFDDFLKNAVNAGLNGMVEVLNQDGINLCGEFADKIKINFTYHEAFRHSVSCTWSDVIDNLESFYGDIQEGGWSAFMTMNVQPENDPNGAYMETWAAYVQKVKDQEVARKTEAESGKGFQGVKECRQWLDDTESDNPADCLTWETLTPGVSVAGRLEAAVGTDLRQLEMADEISEIVGALARQVLSSIFEDDSTSSPKGLGGHTSSSDTLQSDAGTKFTALWTDTKSYYAISSTLVGTVPLTQSIRQQIVDNYTVAISNIANIIACINGGLTCLTTGWCWDFDHPGTIDDINEIKDWASDLTKYSTDKINAETDKDAAQAKLDDSATFLSELEAFWNEVNGIKIEADTNGDDEVTVAELTPTGITNKDITNMKSELSDFKTSIDEDSNLLDSSKYTKEQAKQDCEACDDDPIGGNLSCTVSGTVVPGTATITHPQPSNVICDQGNYKYLIDEPDASTGDDWEWIDPGGGESSFLAYNGEHGTKTKSSCGGTSTINGPGWGSNSGCALPGGDQLYLSNHTGTNPNSSTIARWTPNIGKAGEYEVWVSWRASENRSTNTAFYLHTATNDYSFSINQQGGDGLSCDRPDAGYWAKLGTYELTTGMDTYVEMRNNSGHSEGIDSAGFIYTGTVDAATCAAARSSCSATKPCCATDCSYVCGHYGTGGYFCYDKDFYDDPTLTPLEAGECGL